MMNSSPSFVSVIIPAAGQGDRMNSKCDKLQIALSNKSILLYSLDAFEQAPSVNEIILVTSETNLTHYQKEYLRNKTYRKIKQVILGGKRRQDSVYQGLLNVSKESEIILVHDGARPFVSQDLIQSSVEAAIQHGASVPGVPSKATLKESDSNQFVKKTVNRDKIFEIQTPQAFKKDILQQAFAKGLKEYSEVTDESMLVEAIGKAVKIVTGSYENIKITTQEDLILAESILKNKGAR